MAWDIDDVLNELMRNWLEQEWLYRNPASVLTYQQLLSNPPHRFVGISLEQYQASLDQFRQDRYLELPPRPEVCAWFQQHGARFRHVALTAAPRRFAPTSAQWVFRHFGDWIRTFHFIPSKRSTDLNLPMYDDRKSGFLEWIGKVDIFVDDTPENLSGTSELGVKPVMIPAPWNREERPVKEVLECLAAL